VTRADHRRLLQQLSFSELCHFSWDNFPANTMAYDRYLSKFKCSTDRGNFSVFCIIYCLYAPVYVGIPFLDSSFLYFSTALENAQFLPVMCTPQLVNDCFLPAMYTPQKEGFKRARRFLDVCLNTSRSMPRTRIVTVAWGGAVWAIRLINQKQLLLVMVGIDIILSVGNEYVKLAWEFTGMPWRE
jgi:hypothetical protein